MQLSTSQIKDSAKKKRAKRALARRRFLDFITYQSPWFEVNWHHRVLAEALERIENGKLKRLIICLPPRHGKSEMVSVSFPPWLMGKNKDKNVIAISYSDVLATKFGRDARNIVDSEKYKRIFKTKLAEDSQAKSTWSTNGRGSYSAIGVGGAATGKGADVLIIDDPTKNRKEAESEVFQNNLYSFFQSAALTRLSPDGAIIVTVTRWHDADLVGKILESETGHLWETIVLPAIAEENEPNRKKGEALWETRYNLQRLKVIKSEIGSYEWSALYQQKPINSETQEFKKEMFKSIKESDVKRMLTSCFVTIDSSVAENEDSDYTGVVINRVNTINDWHLKSYRKRLNSPQLINEIFKIWIKEKPEVIGIEKTLFVTAIQPYFKIECDIRNIYPNMYMLKHKGHSKELRIRGVIPRYEAGKVYHIENECETLEEQLLRFPKGANDDEPDALAYQSDIVVAPVAPPDIISEAVADMQIDQRTGYMR